MTFMRNFNLELNHIGVRIIFLNGRIDETIYMVHPKRFVSGDQNNMVCKVKKSIYGIKQASR